MLLFPERCPTGFDPDPCCLSAKYLGLEAEMLSKKWRSGQMSHRFWFGSTFLWSHQRDPLWHFPQQKTYPPVRRSVSKKGIQDGRFGQTALAPDGSLLEVFTLLCICVYTCVHKSLGSIAVDISKFITGGGKFQETLQKGFSQVFVCRSEEGGQYYSSIPGFRSSFGHTRWCSVKVCHSCECQVKISWDKTSAQSFPQEQQGLWSSDLMSPVNPKNLPKHKEKRVLHPQNATQPVLTVVLAVNPHPFSLQAFSEGASLRNAKDDIKYISRQQGLLGMLSLNFMKLDFNALPELCCLLKKSSMPA